MPAQWEISDAHATFKLCSACRRTSSTCSRVTPGNHSRKSSMRAPPSRFSNSALTGTRVFLNSHSPLTFSGERSTAGHWLQSSIRQSYGCRAWPASCRYGILIGANPHYVNPVSTPDIILIAGPTASGKSALALALAEKLGGVIINADSMQVYRDLRIITARPTPDEEERAPHLLYGHVDAAENFSVGRWCTE